MSGTRQANPNRPLRQERFASSPEHEVGLLANLVALRCRGISDPSIKKVLWYIQAASHHRPGGLDRLARDLLMTCPQAVEELAPDLTEAFEALGYDKRWTDSDSERQDRAASYLVEHLQKVCLDPEQELDPPQWSGFLRQLTGFMETEAAAVERQRPVTEIGHRIYAALDYCRESHSLVVVEGLARLGKSVAVRTWCAQSAGMARYVEVPPTNDDGSFFREIARAVGVASRYTFKAVQMRERIEDVLRTGDLMVVFDDAQWAWPQGDVRQATPRRINWILSALVNKGAPVAMVGTPQWSEGQRAIERAGRWSSAQLIGRIGLFDQLSDVLSESDLRKVAQSALPGIGARDLEGLVSYARASAKYLAGIEFAARRAQYLAGKEGRSEIRSSDIKTAIRESIPSDAALAKAAGKVWKGRCKSPETRLLAPSGGAEPRIPERTTRVAESALAGATN